MSHPQRRASNELEAPTLATGAGANQAAEADRSFTHARYRGGGKNANHIEATDAMTMERSTAVESASDSGDRPSSIT